MRQSLPFVPVLVPRSGAVGQIVADVAKRAERGMAVRVRPRGQPVDGSRDLVRELLELGSAGVELDLLLDFEYLAPDQQLTARDIARIVTAYEASWNWRTITVAATTVPESFADLVHEGELRPLARREWQAYRDLVNDGFERIRFASYGVQNCIPPDSGFASNMVAGIRFADQDSLWVGRGRGRLNEMSGDEKAEAFAELARALMRVDSFVGRGCCEGDRFVEDVADGRKTSRRPEEWRRSGTLHDFVLNTNALAALRGRRPDTRVRDEGSVSVGVSTPR